MMLQLQNRLTQWVKPVFLWWALIGVGIILRLRQYFSERSLWADEASLAFNIVNRTFAGLTLPLDYRQGAPVGFLFIEKTLVILFGNRDQIMRLFPLFSGIFAIYFFYRIAQAHVKGGMFAALLFAISWPLVYYSSELKQYSSDVMIGLLLVFLSDRCLKGNARSRDFLVLGIMGIMAIWVSHPSTFILAGIGLAMFFAAISRNRLVPIRWLFGLGAMWMLSFGVEYFVSLHHLVADKYLHNYWAKAFMPYPPWRNLDWFLKTYYSILLIALNRTDQILAVLIPVLILIGCLALLYRERLFLVVIISPFFIALFASAVQIYPLKDRFMLFLVPFMLFLIAEGLGRIYMIIAKWHPGIASVVYVLPALLLFLLMVNTTFGFFLSPMNDANIKPIMAYVAENRLDDEMIYVYHGADPAFNYYAPFYDLDQLHQKDVLVGFDAPRKKIALERFFDDVKMLKERGRVWFIFSHIVDCGGCDGDMQMFYLNYLNGHGTMLDSVHAVGANAYLYDLNP